MTSFEHTLIGGGSGALEVCIMQPLVAIKNALQEGRPIPTNPLHLYRGLLVRGHASRSHTHTHSRTPQNT